MVDLEQYYFNMHKCTERYRDMMTARGDIREFTGPEQKLWDFIHETMFSIRDRAPILKMNRWLGYIQGVLIERGYTTVEIERDWSRPLFRPLDFPDGP